MYGHEFNSDMVETETTNSNIINIIGTCHYGLRSNEMKTAFYFLMHQKLSEYVEWKLDNKKRILVLQDINNDVAEIIDDITFCLSPDAVHINPSNSSKIFDYIFSNNLEHIRNKVEYTVTTDCFIKSLDAGLIQVVEYYLSLISQNGTVGRDLDVAKIINVSDNIDITRRLLYIVPVDDDCICRIYNWSWELLLSLLPRQSFRWDVVLETLAITGYEHLIPKILEHIPDKKYDKCMLAYTYKQIDLMEHFDKDSLARYSTKIIDRALNDNDIDTIVKLCSKLNNNKTLEYVIDNFIKRIVDFSDFGHFIEPDTLLRNLELLVPILNKSPEFIRFLTQLLDIVVNHYSLDIKQSLRFMKKQVVESLKNSQKQVIELLVKHGADIQSLDINDYFFKSPELGALLVDLGMDITKLNTMIAKSINMDSKIREKYINPLLK